MSEFDLTMRAAMQDDSMFYDLLERARKKGQSLQEFFISLGRKELESQQPAQNSAIVGPKNNPVVLQRVMEQFFAEADSDPVAFAHRLGADSDWVESLDPWEVRELCGFDK